MAEAVIVEAVRSPIGKRNGGLSGVHPGELSAQVLNGLVERAGVDPALVDDLIWGCVGQVSPALRSSPPARSSLSLRPRNRPVRPGRRARAGRVTAMRSSWWIPTRSNSRSNSRHSPSAPTSFTPPT
jgi:hypothetical protein